VLISVRRVRRAVALSLEPSEVEGRMSGALTVGETKPPATPPPADTSAMLGSLASGSPLSYRREVIVQDGMPVLPIDEVGSLLVEEFGRMGVVAGGPPIRADGSAANHKVAASR
jgi:hypothetical protein